jgi:hypothetical protein
MIGNFVHGMGVQGSGHLKSETRHVGSFSKVRVEGSIDVEAKIGSQTDLKVSADDNLLSLIKTRVEGDTLIIRSEGSFSTNNRMVVQFSAPKIQAASVAGSGDVKVDGLRGGDFAASISGSGDISATGSAGAVSVSIAGSGDASLKGLQSSSATVSISGSGDASVNTSGPLSVVINGSGDVVYSGKPTSIAKKINGSGSVEQG